MFISHSIEATYVLAMIIIVCPPELVCRSSTGMAAMGGKSQSVLFLPSRDLSALVNTLGLLPYEHRDR